MRALVAPSLRLARRRAARRRSGLVFNRTGSGARAAGMANAFIAVSDDGTAASWNPARPRPAPQAGAVDREHHRGAEPAGARASAPATTCRPSRRPSSSYRSTYLDFASLAVPVTLWGKPVTFQGAWRRLYSLDYREILDASTREPLVPEGPPAGALRRQQRRGGQRRPRLARGRGEAHAAPRRWARSFNLWRGDWDEDPSVSRDAARRHQRRPASRPPARRTACAARTSPWA